MTLVVAGCLGGTGSVREGNTTPLDGPEEAPEDAHPGAQAHVHDRWDGQSVKTLLDDTIRMENPMEVMEHSSVWSYMNCQFYCNIEVDFTLPEGVIVPPGTERVEVHAVWDQESGLMGRSTDLVLHTQAANQTDFHELDAQDSPATWSIDTAVEMADDGHARYSLWRFRLTACECAVIEVDDTWEFPIDVRIVAHRAPGPLPLEPPHPDWWANGTDRPVWSDEGSTDRIGYGESYVRPSGGFALGGSYFNTVYRDDHDVIPPGTHELRAWFNWTNDAPAADAAPPEPWLAWDNKDWDWTMWEPTRTEPGRYVYVLPVTDRMVDGMYGEMSRWRFRYGFWGDDQGMEDPAFGGPADPYVIDGEWSVVIRAYTTTSANAVASR